MQGSVPVKARLIGDLYGRFHIEQGFGRAFAGVQQNLHPATRIHRQLQGIRLSFHPLKRDRSGQCSVFVAKRSGNL